MVEAGREPRLALEAGAEVGVLRQLVGQQLEGHLAAELPLLGEVDDAHAAAAEDPFDVIRPEVGAEARVRTRRGHGAMYVAIFRKKSYSAFESPCSLTARTMIASST